MRRVVAVVVVGLAGAVFAVRATWDGLHTEDAPVDIAQLAPGADQDVARRDMRAQAGDAPESDEADRDELADATRAGGNVSIHVEIVDAHDAPCAGVPLSVAEAGGRYRWVIAADTTDEAGRAGLSFEPTALSVEVSAAVPGARAARAILDATPAKDGRLRWRLPPTGRVVVEVVDRDGRAADEHALRGVLLRGAGEDDGCWPRLDALSGFGCFPSLYTDPRGGQLVDVEDGRAVFPRVAIGARLVAYAAPRDDELVTTRVEFDGPSAEGEERRVRVSIGEPRPVLTGRLVDAAGDGIAGVELFAAVARAGWLDDGDTVRADEDGGFAIPIDLVGVPFRGALVVLRTPGVCGPEDLLHVAIPESAALTGWDVGDVADARVQEAARGVVVDPSGAPVSRAELWLARGSEPADVPFSPNALSETDGRFTIRGSTREGAILVARADDDSALAGVFRVPAAPEDLRCVLERAGTIAGRLVAPTGFDFRDVRVFARGSAFASDSSEPATPYVLRLTDEGDGRFALVGVPPGTWDVLVVDAQDDAHTVRSVPGVRVVAGEVSSDPRLVALDLTAGRTPVRVTAHDTEGRAIARCRVYAREPLRAGWLQLETGDDGAVVILAERGSLDVIACIPGFRTERHNGVTADTAFVLRPAAFSDVHLVPTPDVAYPDASLALSARLRWLGELDGTGSRIAEDADPRDVVPEEGVGFRAARALTLRAWTPGRYAVVPTLSLEWAEVDLACTTDPAMVVIPAGGGAVEVRVTPDADALAQAIDDLRRGLVPRRR